MSRIEIVAVLSGLVCVWLTTRQNIWCWPVGLLMVSLYIVIFYRAKLYSDMGLQVVYVGLQLFGWHQWLRGGPRRSKLGVTRASALTVALWGIGAAGCVVALGVVMQTQTDAALPYWDAVTTVLSLVAQVWMARKVLESWAVWIVVDVLAVGIYTVKELYLTAGLYAVFLGLAVMGWFAWKRSMTPQPAPITPPAPAE
ncbi:nicotinamide riboside transporter PnuC [Phycisphaeraceae bacterium D3-23]